VTGVEDKVGEIAVVDTGVGDALVVAPRTLDVLFSLVPLFGVVLGLL